MPSIPDDLPSAPAAFWAAEPLPDPPPEPEAPTPVLERLGPSPFPRSGFPFLGFLASVYDQVAASAASPPAPVAGR